MLGAFELAEMPRFEASVDFWAARYDLIHNVRSGNTILVGVSGLACLQRR